MAPSVVVATLLLTLSGIAPDMPWIILPPTQFSIPQAPADLGAVEADVSVDATVAPVAKDEPVAEPIGAPQSEPASIIEPEAEPLHVVVPSLVCDPLPETAPSSAKEAECISEPERQGLTEQDLEPMEPLRPELGDNLPMLPEFESESVEESPFVPEMAAEADDTTIKDQEGEVRETADPEAESIDMTLPANVEDTPVIPELPTDALEILGDNPEIESDRLVEPDSNPADALEPAIANDETISSEIEPAIVEDAPFLPEFELEVVELILDSDATGERIEQDANVAEPLTPATADDVPFIPEMEPEAVEAAV